MKRPHGLSQAACLEISSDFGQPQPGRTWISPFDLLFNLANNFRSHIHPALVEEIKNVLFLKIEPRAARFPDLLPIFLVEVYFNFFQRPVGMISQQLNEIGVIIKAFEGLAAINENFVKRAEMIACDERLSNYPFRKRSMSARRFAKTLQKSGFLSAGLGRIRGIPALLRLIE